MACVYRKWCEVEGKQVYLEAHAGERENGVIELVVYNQKLAIKKNEGSLGTLKSSNEDQVPKYALDNHNNTIFDDVQMLYYLDSNVSMSMKKAILTIPLAGQTKTGAGDIKIASKSN